MMRFLMLNWRDPLHPRAGSAEWITGGYLAALARRGHEVWWFAHAFEGSAPEEQVGAIHIVRGGGVGTSVIEAIAWCRRQAPFDLVIDRHHGVPWYAPWWCRTRCVACVYEVLGPVWDSMYPWPLNLIGRWQENWTQWIYRHVPFWTVSRFTSLILKRNGVRNVTLLPCGTQAIALPHLDDKPLSAPLRLVTVSRLAGRQRVDHALHTARCLLDQGVPVQLDVVGTGELEAPLQELAMRLNLDRHVRFAGALNESDKNDIVRRSHFLLHTSLREGWGLSVIEANAMGTPAAVYPVAGLTESTVHDHGGIVARDERPECLAEGIAAVLKTPDKYQRYRRHAWERACSSHWDRVSPQACDWFEAQARHAAPGSAS